jgi:hypothetical protein
MPQPFLHCGNVGAMRQGIGGGRRPHRMHAKTRRGPGNADLLCISCSRGSDGKAIIFLNDCKTA